MIDHDRSKIIVLDDRFPKTGEPTIQPVVLWGLRGKPCYESLSKEASVSPAYEYIRHIEPCPGRTIVLVIGLGSFEYYGLNRNGDGFNEQPYKPGQSNGPGRDAWVMEDECIQHHFPSYEKGHVFRHHVNKDPKRSVGRVIKAFWNPYMHRVEILEDIDNNKAPDLVEQIADGDFPAKSMGCRIKFDVCTECGNRAPTRKQYCDHLKWQMNFLDPKTGVRYGALNPSPRFFDSSWVLRPADRTGYMLKKVAWVHEVQGYSSSELGELVDDLNTKSAAAKKLAVIDKVVRGYPAAVVQSELPEAGLIEKYRDTSLPSVAGHTSELSRQDLDTLAPYNLADTLAALSRHGILLTTPEFVQLFLEKAAPGTIVPRHILDRVTALQAEMFELFSQHPSLLNQLTASMDCPTGQDVDAAITPLLEKRSTVGGYLRRRLLPRDHSEAPNTDLLEVRDYNQDVYDDRGQLVASGPTYQTTRGASRAARDALDETNLKRLLGAGGLMAGAYKTLATPGARMLSLPLAGLGVFLGQSGLKDPKTYTTTTGEKIPMITELQKQSSVLDLVNTLGLEYGITKTGAEVLKRAAWRLTTDHPLRPFMAKASSFGLQHPALTLSRIVTEHEKAASDGITEEQLDIEKVAEVIGTLALAIS
jgi:hypothetical protein